jgi:receptor protein-tyrosine kinase
VILVDADLRRARLSRKFGTSPQLGLSSVLSGELPLSEALIDYRLEDPVSGQLTLLPAGSPQRNASALISSPEMGRVLDQLSSEGDLVIIDTPAALAVGDPLALMRSVSGVILVARMNVSRRRTLGRLARMIVAAQATLLGVVAVGVTRGVDYYGHGYSHDGENGTRAGSVRDRLRHHTTQRN